MRLVTTKYKIDGKLVDVYVDNLRKGSLSPQAVYYRYKGRWISAFERKIRGWSFPISLLFKVVYQEGLKDLVYKDNPLLIRL